MSSHHSVWQEYTFKIIINRRRSYSKLNHLSTTRKSGNIKGKCFRFFFPVGFRYVVFLLHYFLFCRSLLHDSFFGSIFLQTQRPGCIKRCQVVVKVNIMWSDLIGGYWTFYLNQRQKCDNMGMAYFDYNHLE
jgi:hypothetical protein